MGEDNKKYVVHGMCAECSMGTMKNYLNTDVGHGVVYQGQPLLNANDHKPQINLTHFGDCKSSMSKCQPVTLLPWIFCNDKHMIDGAPALTIESVCTCMFGGVIKIVEQTEKSNVEVDGQSEETVDGNMTPAYAGEKIQVNLLTATENEGDSDKPSEENRKIPRKIMDKTKKSDKQIKKSNVNQYMNEEEYIAFIADSTLDFSPVTNSEIKQETLKVTYYVLHNGGFDDVIIAGVMGNILSEGNAGQFEKIPYGQCKLGKEDVPYYQNSWNNLDVYTQFPHRQDTNPTADNKSDAHEYANSYSNKLAYEIKDFTIGELKQMLSIRTNGPYGENIFGYGPLQATTDDWHNKYLAAIADLGFSDDTLITKEVTLLIDARLSLNAVTEKCKDKPLPYVDSNGSYEEPINMFKYKNTFDDVINGVQVEDPALQEVCRFSAYWTTMVEICYGFKDINTIVERAKQSVQCYQQLQKWKNGGASE